MHGYYVYEDRFDSFHWIGTGIMGLFWIALFGFGIWAVVALVRRPSHAAPTAPAVTPRPGETAREILDRRLAVGEITHDEYTSARKLLDTANFNATESGGTAAQ